MFKKRNSKKDLRLDYEIKNEEPLSKKLDKMESEIKLKSSNLKFDIKKKPKEISDLNKNFEKKTEENIDYKNLIEEEKKKLELFDKKKNYPKPEDKKTENSEIEEIKKYEKKIMEENEEKPFWSIGLIELENNLKYKINLIEKFDEIIENELELKLEKKFFGTEKKKLIPDEDFLVQGNMWAIPKKVIRKQKLDKEKIKNEFFRNFNNR
jgi:hypothetical protein